MESKEKLFGEGVSCIVMSQNDNVVTLLRSVKEGEVLTFTIEDSTCTLTTKEDVGFGHKLALKRIGNGETISKYGESIGVATTTIEEGEHVHVHNLIGVRGRGDQ
ncbi:UxaA family hydrolase [Peribacillus loiseleuriae]|uniref:UxaA family hydrolase n=1 Tax=Peribacillus loiseleuriae TaxID=1679170 RepID=UPI003D0744AB